MSLVTVAIVGKSNHPLYLRDFDCQVHLPLCTPQKQLKEEEQRIQDEHNNNKVII